MNNLYLAARTQLENTQRQCHDIKTQLYTTQQQYKTHATWLQGQVESTQRELEREREVSEVANQQLLALKDRYINF
jgi:DNA-binding FrmR family transcriptional regulator